MGDLIGENNGPLLPIIDSDDPLSDAVLKELEAQHRKNTDTLTIEQLDKENEERVKFLCNELKARCHREQIYEDDFLFRMFDVIIYPEGEDGPGYKFWWMSQGHPIVQWIWENFGLQDKKPDVVVPVRGWGTAIIYADEVVQAAVEQITEKAEECGFEIIRVEPSAAVEMENIQQQNAIMQEGNETTMVVPLSSKTTEKSNNNNIKLNGVNHSSTPPPPPPLLVASGPPMIKINKPATTKKGD